eukprot:TRINITY_DN5512_c1_g1_i1.p1 TRINITY_DN5512_c1_g1~~TRINITY_DN5512_c1_g1_i1.p1  ORF type:complete len:342 (+),score=25.22 TRINITY_DN5512_c1_g1_i1:291-1316(+)
MNDSEILEHFTKTTRYIPPLVAVLFIVLSTVWTTLLLGKLFIVYFHPGSEFVWLSRKLKNRKINYTLAKLLLILITLIFASLTAFFKTAQQFKTPEPKITIDNCSDNDPIDFIELAHLYDGLSQLCLLTMFSFLNITTLFLQKVFSSSQDFRLVKLLIFVTLTLKIIVILPLNFLTTTFIWIQAFVLMFIYLEYAWLVVNERKLYRIIKAKIRKLQDLDTRSEQREWEEKRLANLWIYSMMLFGSSCLLILLPLNWTQIFLDYITASCTQVTGIDTISITPQLKHASEILNITENLLHIPLLLMVIVYFGLTGFVLLSYLMRYCRRVREDTMLSEALLQKD